MSKELITKIKDIYGINKYSLEFYPSDSNCKKPFALICPGGGYSAVMSSCEGLPFAKKLNELGYSVFVLRYRVRKRAHFPAPIDDIARAVKEICDNADKYNVLVNGYSVWGSSAGGHAVGCFASEKQGFAKYNLPKPSAIILTYPVITMTDLTHKGSINNFLGKEPTESEIRDWSVENLVNKNYPPTFVWNSKTDKTVNPINSQMLNESLDKYDVSHSYMLFETGEHGCGLGEGTECEVWFDKAVEFWEKAYSEGAERD